MAETSSESKKEKGPDLIFTIARVFALLVKDTAVEFWRGVRLNTIPWPICCGVGALFSIVFALRFDAPLWRCWPGARFYPFHPLLYWPYVAIYTTSGFWLWSIGRALSRRILAKQLTTAFRNAGLETRTKRLPGLITNEQVDTQTRKLVVSSVGLPESEFVRAKPHLEASLQIFIDQIKSHVDRGTVELLYAYNPMSERYVFDSGLAMKPLSFRVGLTRTRALDICLRDVPHILCAGYTNSGKSGFVRQLLTTLMLNNPGIEFTLVDLKSGTELGAFEGISNVKLYLSALAAIQALKYVESQLDKRMALLRANRVSDLDAFHRLPQEKRKFTAEWPKEKPFTRHVVAIDEAAELFLAGATLASKDAQVAKRLAAKIAALGRAVGIHLIVATQRPDRYAVDPLIKSNLQGRLCFQMSDNASSMTILDSARAADLPPTKGRAIWRSGFDLIEVQVPWLEPDAMEKLIAPLREKKIEVSQPTITTTQMIVTDATTKTVETPTASSVGDGISMLEERKAHAADESGEMNR